MDKFEAEYRAKLTPAQFHILREKGTEPPFSGRYYMTNENGIYHCAACHNPLFDSKHKFFSSCGWPSFDNPIPSSVEFFPDHSHGMERTEVVCAKCGSHLGHVFPTGRPTAASATALTPSLWISKTKTIRIMSFNFPKLRYMRRARLRSESK